MRQKGFATLEVILMILVIAILASIAVPRFTAVSTVANTAKIQADLSTIDAAVAIYIMEKGTTSVPTSPSGLGDYLQDANNLKPPTGKAYINGTATQISATDYAIAKDGTSDDYRATLDNHKSGEFTTKASSSSGSGSQTGGNG